MYVCLCMGVSDREIKKLVGEGARSVDEIMRCSGAGTRCGSCIGEIAGMVGEKTGPVGAARCRLVMCPSSTAA
jgi:bacterioferritin-associated ferredoxin